ncbi:hypothetical protein HanPSC8_Chr11g0451471 [Helianthus annuus]|nr:hypothetical protein HanPSC8_Chr11g0451471 [Helianthus annuus]
MGFATLQLKPIEKIHFSKYLVQHKYSPLSFNHFSRNPCSSYKHKDPIFPPNLLKNP